MDTNPQLMAALKALMGRTLAFRDQSYQVIDVLREGPSLVLATPGTTIQPDLHGDPRRRVQRTRTVAVYEAPGGELNPALVELLDAETVERLRRLSAGAPPA